MNKGTTVAVSNEHLKKLHKICEEDKRTVKAVVNIALEKYFEDRKI